MRYLLIILLGILTYSCVEEDNQDGMVIGNVSFTLGSTTRANELIEFVEGDAVGVYVLDRSKIPLLNRLGIMRITGNLSGTVIRKPLLRPTMII